MSMQVREFEERDAGQVARIMFESFRTFLGERMEKDAPESEAYWIRCSSGKRNIPSPVPLWRRTGGG